MPRVAIKNGAAKVPDQTYDTETILRDLASGKTIEPYALKFEDIQASMAEVVLTVQSVTPLIVHRWSEKAKEMMRQSQMGSGRQRKQPKNSEEDFLGTIHFIQNTGDLATSAFGFPAVGFKAAAAATWDMMEGLKKKAILAAFHIINGEGPDMLVRLETGIPIKREDMVRIAGGTADLRYRAQFDPWKARLHIRFNKRLIQIAQLVQIFSLAGDGVGIGESRPGRGGAYGRFKVAGLSLPE